MGHSALHSSVVVSYKLGAWRGHPGCPGKSTSGKQLEEIHFRKSTLENWLQEINFRRSTDGKSTDEKWSDGPTLADFTKSCMRRDSGEINIRKSASGNAPQEIYSRNQLKGSSWQISTSGNQLEGNQLPEINFRISTEGLIVADFTKSCMRRNLLVVTRWFTITCSTNQIKDS